MHFHSFELILFVEDSSEDFVLYGDFEKVVHQCLKPYEYKNLGNIEPFNHIEPTMENIGHVFYSKLEEALKTYGFKLIRLEISETPSRTYIVSPYDKKLKEDKVKELLIKNILSYTEEEMIKASFELDQKNLAHEKTENPMLPDNQADDSQEKQGYTHQTGQYDDDQKEQEQYLRNLLYMEELPIWQDASTPGYQSNKNNKGSKRSENRLLNYPGVKTGIAIFILVVLSYLLLSYIRYKGYGPLGLDIYGHLFKADIVYEGIKKGNIYPLFTEYWYNGMQPFRYWGIVPYYIFAVCQAVARGDVYEGYYFFIALMFFVGAVGWLLWGIKYNRIFISMIFGILWFFMPDNLRVLFGEGNIPRVVITTIFPYFLFFFWMFIEERKKKSALMALVIFTLSILSHLMISAMIGIATFIFLFFYALMCKQIKRPVQMILMMLCAFAVCGIWVYPALKGGLVSMNKEATAEAMSQLSMPFTVSLNPFLRLKKSGDFYYGLSVLLISLTGLIAAYKKSQAGFITAIIIFLGTTTAFIPLLSKLPLNQLLWMWRFTPMAYGFFLMAIFNWQSLKKLILAGMLFFLILDGSLSFNLSYYSADQPKKVTRVLDEAKKITTQRILLLDNSEFSSYPSYYLVKEGKRVPYAYGWAWQGAATAQNIMLLNTALEKGYYNYMFDRAVEMGCDTIIIKKTSLSETKNKWEDLKEAAQLSQYYLYKETPESYIAHRNINGTFGVRTDYKGLCIGRSAAQIPLLYPYFEYGDSFNIEDYSLEELSRYKVIFLSDFTYNSRKKAEQVITTLSRQGVKIIIDMNRIPIDETTNRMKFLGVHAQPITLYKEFGDLYFEEKVYKGKAFSEEYEAWNTVYLDNLDKITGFIWMNNQKLAFMGKKSDDNITFMGFNLWFHAMVHQDEMVKKLLTRATGIEEFLLPERELVPLRIAYDRNVVTIISSEDHVNTTLAFLDAYKSEDLIWGKNNLLYVNQGQTRIKVTYPYLLQGSLVSLTGIILFIILFKRIDSEGMTP